MILSTSLPLLVYIIMLFGVNQAINGIWNQIGADIDGESSDDSSGYSVALSADGVILAVGAPGNGAYSGHVRVYGYNGTLWIQIGADIDGEGRYQYSGFSIALSADGTILAVGVPINGDQSGYVRVYEYIGGSWIQTGADIDGEGSGDNSGYSVALSADGTILAVGAPNNDGNGTNYNAGHVRIYEYNGSVWIQIGADIDGETSFDDSGDSVALSADGTIVAVAAPGDDDNGAQSGHVRIYEYNGDLWIQIGADIDGEGKGYGRGEQSRYSVALSADGAIVAVGVPGNVDGDVASGHVRVYEYNGGLWIQIGADIDGEGKGDDSGVSVALSADGTILAVGAVGNDDSGSNAGHVRVYGYNGSLWIQIGPDIDGEESADYSGGSIALSADGTILAVGATGNDGKGPGAGHVRCFDLLTASPSMNPTESSISPTVTTSNPTTAIPTTSMPTTSIPTTARPSVTDNDEVLINRNNSNEDIDTIIIIIIICLLIIIIIFSVLISKGLQKESYNQIEMGEQHNLKEGNEGDMAQNVNDENHCIENNDQLDDIKSDANNDKNKDILNEAYNDNNHDDFDIIKHE